MKREWKNPELKNLNLQATNEGVEPYYWHPRYPECQDSANTGEGYQMCTDHGRPCKYFGILGGGSYLAECNAPSRKNPS